MIIYRGHQYKQLNRVASRDHDTVPVPEHHQERVFYHGTASDETAQQILQAGELRPGRTRDENWSSAPVAGQVYLTPSLKYVLSYVLGAHESCDPGTLCEHGGQYGYLFVVPGSTLTDLLPDEDTVGELLCSEEFSWLNDEYNEMASTYWQDLEDISYQMAESEYEGIVADDDWDEDILGPIPSWDEYLAEYSLNTLLVDCSYPVVPVVGKFFLRHADEDTLLQLLEELENIDGVSHGGAIQFAEAWRFDKNLTPKLSKDGSNFFDLAEKVT